MDRACQTSLYLGQVVQLCPNIFVMDLSPHYVLVVSFCYYLTVSLRRHCGSKGDTQYALCSFSLIAQWAPSERGSHE